MIKNTSYIECRCCTLVGAPPLFLSPKSVPSFRLRWSLKYFLFRAQFFRNAAPVDSSGSWCFLCMWVHKTHPNTWNKPQSWQLCHPRPTDAFSNRILWCCELVRVLFIVIFSGFNVESDVLYILQFAACSIQQRAVDRDFLLISIKNHPMAKCIPLLPQHTKQFRAQKDKEYIQAYSSFIKSLHLSYCELASLVLVMSVISEVSKMIMI